MAHVQDEETKPVPPSGQVAAASNDDVAYIGLRSFSAEFNSSEDSESHGQPQCLPHEGVPQPTQM